MYMKKGRVYFDSPKQMVWYVELMMMYKEKRKGVLMFFTKKHYKQIVETIDVLSRNNLMVYLYMHKDNVMLITTKKQEDLDELTNNLTPEAIGRFCGYPECCIQSFIKKNKSGECKTEGLGSKFESCFLNVVYRDWTKEMHSTYISHIPCSEHCEKSNEIYRLQKKEFLRVTDGKSYKEVLISSYKPRRIKKARIVGVIGIEQKNQGD